MNNTGSIVKLKKLLHLDRYIFRNKSLYRLLSRYLESRDDFDEKNPKYIDEINMKEFIEYIDSPNCMSFEKEQVKADLLMALEMQKLAKKVKRAGHGEETEVAISFFPKIVKRGNLNDGKMGGISNVFFGFYLKLINEGVRENDIVRKILKVYPRTEDGDFCHFIGEFNIKNLLRTMNFYTEKVEIVKEWRSKDISYTHFGSIDNYDGLRSNLNNIKLFADRHPEHTGWKPTVFTPTTARDSFSQEEMDEHSKGYKKVMKRVMLAIHQSWENNFGNFDERDEVGFVKEFIPVLQVSVEVEEGYSEIEYFSNKKIKNISYAPRFFGYPKSQQTVRLNLCQNPNWGVRSMPPFFAFDSECDVTHQLYTDILEGGRGEVYKVWFKHDASSS